MTYFKDLTEYEYSPHFLTMPAAKNVGWLQLGHDFEREKPTDEILDLLWESCSISVAQFRGIHPCEFCNPTQSVYAERHGKTLLLGTAEIRAFSPLGEIYAAPTLIYHYVQVHHYKLPDEFLNALRLGLRPPSSIYFEKLEELKLEWRSTTKGEFEPHRFQLEVVPRTFIGEPPINKIPLDQIQEGLFPWENTDPEAKFLDAIRQILPLSTSREYSDEYCTEDRLTSTISIWREGEVIENIQYCYLPGNDSRDRLHNFLELVKSFNYLLVEFETGIVLEPNDVWRK